MKLLNNLKLVLGGVAVASLAACGGGGGGTAESGTLRLALTDAPACGYDAVNVTIQKVRVHQSSTASESDGGWSEIVLNPAKRVNLLDLQNGLLEELGEMPLPTGKYTQLRLVLADNTGSGQPANSVVLTSDKSEVALKTPSGQQSGVKTNINIDIGANQMADFVLDFDACKSVVLAGGSDKYLLKPVVTVIPNYVSGVAGFVDPAIVVSGYTNVSLQKDGVVVKATTPRTTTIGTTTTSQFLLRPVAPGSYTLVMTAPGRTTAVVTGVTVAAETVTSVNASATPLNPAVSATGTLTGTAPVETMVRALQVLTGSTPANVEVAGGFVVPTTVTTGNYSYVLPVAAPLIAPYVAGSPLVFASDVPSTAGNYTLSASLNGAVKTVTPATLTSGATVTATPITFP